MHHLFALFAVLVAVQATSETMTLQLANGFISGATPEIKNVVFESVYPFASMKRLNGYPTSGPYVAIWANNPIATISGTATLYDVDLFCSSASLVIEGSDLYNNRYIFASIPVQNGLSKTIPISFSTTAFPSSTTWIIRLNFVLAASTCTLNVPLSSPPGTFSITANW